jgi:hypothetical protein
MVLNCTLKIYFVYKFVNDDEYISFLLLDLLAHNLKLYEIMGKIFFFSIYLNEFIACKAINFNLKYTISQHMSVVVLQQAIIGQL